MIEKPRGTRDFLPEDMDKRRYIEDTIRKIFESFGYREVQTPTLEKLNLFTAKSGDEILGEIYSFKDKSGRDLALRPELTAPVIRMYIEKMQMDPKPIKLFYIENCFRYDRPQKGRYREFTQAGCELIGCDSPACAAELISLAWNILKNIGIKNMKLKIGNLDFVSDLFDRIGIENNLRRKIFPYIDKKQFEELEQELLRENITEENINTILSFFNSNNIDEIKKYIDTPSERFEDILSFLDIFGLNDYQIDTSIVRGIDYYKGVVFEIEAPALGAEKQICGGGEYDLVSIFGGKPISTSGFAIGFDRAIVALEAEGYNFPNKKLKAYIIPISRDYLNYAIEIATMLRNAYIPSDLDLIRRGIRKSLKYADSIGVRNVILIGEDELKNNYLTVRDMKTGRQTKVNKKNIVDFLMEE